MSQSPTPTPTSEQSTSNNPLKKFKLVFLGEQSVGKTSLITRFACMLDVRYLRQHIPSHDRYRLSVKDDVSGRPDRAVATLGYGWVSQTAGEDLDALLTRDMPRYNSQERFRSLIPSYIRDSSVAVIVYDVTNRNSFLNTSKWVDDVRNERGQDVIIVLVGNKTDLNDKRQVTPEDLDKRAKELGVLSIETSAKAGHNVKTLFKKIAMALPGGAESRDAAVNQKIDVSSPTTGEVPQASGCAC